MTIRIKTADPNTTVTIPESVTIGGPGTTSTLQIKNSNGDLVPIKQLFTKIDSVTQGSGSPQTIKIWPFPPTIDPTQPGTNDQGDGGEGQCGACTVGNQVWYPQLYSSTGTPYRWDCGIWNKTGKINSEFLSTPSTSLSTDYYFVYDKAPGQFILPPPPGYIVVDYTTYTVPDWFYVYCSRGSLDLTTWAYQNTIARKFYKFNPIDSNGNPTPPIDSCLSVCNNPCYSNQCVPAGLANPCPTDPCQSTGYTDNINDIILETDQLFNSTCTATSGGCLNYCYTIPEINSFYHCRDVQTLLPPINYNAEPNLTGDCQTQSPLFAVNVSNYYSYDSQNQFNGRYEGPVKFTDIGILNDGDCTASDDSSWHVRIFLPFYVTLPDTLIEKYLKFKTDAQYQNFKQFLDNYPSSPTDIQKVLKQAYDIIAGRIFASGFIYTKSLTNLIYWGAVGFPKELTHTHVLVLEINNYADNDCDVCVQGSSFGTPRYFGFYPITKTDKTFVDPLSDYMKRSIVLSDGTRCGIHNLKQITDISQDAIQECYGQFNFIGVWYGDDDQTNPAGQNSFGNEPVRFNGSLTTAQRRQLTLRKFLDAYYPNKIIIDQDTDCGCTQGIAALTAGSGMEITPVVDGFPNSITLSITDTITDDLETSVVLVESIIDTVTSTASEGADGGTW